MRMTTGEKLFQIFLIIIMLALIVSFLYPFIFMISMSFSTAAEANRAGAHIWPGQVTLTAYKMVFSNPDLLIGYLNTIFRTVVGTVLTLLVTCLCAYPLSRKDLPHRSLMTFLVFFTMLFSGGIIPTYLVIRNLGLVNNVWVYILPQLTNAFNVIIIKNYFESIPQSLAESASIDGANDFHILFKIYIPLSGPVLATVALMTAISHWNMWFDAMIYINDDTKQVLMTFLRRIVIDRNQDLMSGASEAQVSQFTPETIKAATIIVTILPILVLYPFLQKYFVKGIMLGGVKE
ncbi:MAG: carbohydrate ABC transporter permease [Lentisphaerae bacterium]|nr:carbohydrate ABC transporter permease [Lentisphaerota bacterium]MCP4099899.1 carbohydrate ABC transporter permease [Lentisphaerota bacterium]